MCVGVCGRNMYNVQRVIMYGNNDFVCSVVVHCLFVNSQAHVLFVFPFASWYPVHLTWRRSHIMDDDPMLCLPKLKAAVQENIGMKVGCACDMRL